MTTLAPNPGMGNMAKAVETIPNRASTLVITQMDGQRLLLPQQEVVSLEAVMDIRQENARFPVAGLIAWAGQDWPVYCLQGAALTVSLDLPPQRRICVLLHDGYYGLALVCDQVEMLVGPRRARYPVPPCMAKTNSLLEWLVVYEGTVSCVTTAARLAAYCQRSIDPEGSGNG